MVHPVTRDRNNETKIILLDLSEVTHMVYEDGVIAFITKTGKFYPIVPSLSLYEKHLQDMGFLPAGSGQSRQYEEGQGL